MKNQRIYDKYVIKHVPGYFLTAEARDRYNEAIAQYCEKRRDGANDLSIWQSIKRVFLLLYLGATETRDRRHP